MYDVSYILRKQNVRHVVFHLFENPYMIPPLSDRIRIAASHAGMRPAHIASALGKSRSTVQGWFDGKAKSISAEILTSVSRILGVRVEWLANGTGEMLAEPAPETDAGALQASAIPPGFKPYLVPEELAPMIEAWLSLYVNRTLNPAVLESVTALANSLNPAITPQGVAKATPARIAAANKALEEHRAEAVAAGTAGQVKPGVFKTKR